MREGYTLIDLKVLIVLKKRLMADDRGRFVWDDLIKETNYCFANIEKSIKKLQKDGIIYKKGMEYAFCLLKLAREKHKGGRQKSLDEYDERQIIRKLKEGCTKQNIADELGVSVTTVRNYLKKIE